MAAFDLPFLVIGMHALIIIVQLTTCVYISDLLYKCGWWLYMYVDRRKHCCDLTGFYACLNLNINIH